jgi:hypothetical protein
MAEYMSRDRTTFPLISRRLRPIFLHLQCMKFLFYVTEEPTYGLLDGSRIFPQHWSLCDLYISGIYFFWNLLLKDILLCIYCS